MNYFSIYKYSWYIIDCAQIYINPYGYIYSKVINKETIKQICIVTYPYTREYMISKLARNVEPVELQNIKKIKLIKHV